MATRPVDVGDIGRRVAHNLKALRKERNVLQQELSERLAALGRPMAVSAISKIEAGDRRVDVDDLMALSTALGVNPARLLLPHNPGEPIALTPNLTVRAHEAWRWLSGEAPLLSGEGEITHEEMEDFRSHGIPAWTRVADDHPAVVATNLLADQLWTYVFQVANKHLDGRQSAKKRRELAGAVRRLVNEIEILTGEKLTPEMDEFEAVLNLARIQLDRARRESAGAGPRDEDQSAGPAPEAIDEPPASRPKPRPGRKSTDGKRR